MIQKNKTFLNENNISVFSHKAMNTIFELYIANCEIEYATQAAFESFKEIDRLEAILSRYLPNSEISKLNSLNTGESLVVCEDTYKCLLKSLELYEITNGAFDISIGKTIMEWKTGHDNSAKSSSVSGRMILNPEKMSIIIEESVNLDLGGIGKGYAAECVDETLNDWGISNYLLSGGYSTIKVGGIAASTIKWPLTITNPKNKDESSNFNLEYGSLSSSGLQKGDHIINPKLLAPANNMRSSCWVHSSDAIMTDAFSTAFMIMDISEINEICSNDKTISVYIASQDGSDILRVGELFL